MNRREFCVGLAALTAGCGSGDNQVAQEFTLQPSPLLRNSQNVFASGVEGTWTPVITFSTPGDLSVAYSFQLGTYIRIGDLVTVFFDVLTSTGDFDHTTASGTLLITGLPFVSRDETNANMRAVGSLRFQGITSAGYTQMSPTVPRASSQIEIWQSGSGQALQVVAATEVPTNGTVWLSGSVSYLTTVT